MAAYGVCISESRYLAFTEFIHDLLAVEIALMCCLYACSSQLGGKNRFWSLRA